MNARDYKIFRIGNFYHIYNRGNNKELIFKDRQDFLVFLNRLNLLLGITKSSASKRLFANPGQRVSLTSRVRLTPFATETFIVICYCLMPNHFHILLKQNSIISIDRLISRLCTSYSKYFNRKYERVGHVFQDTFKAKLIETDKYIKYLSAYIHNNPFSPLEYEFSSLFDYFGFRNGNLCQKEFLLGMFENDPQLYKQFVIEFAEQNKMEIQHLLFED